MVYAYDKEILGAVWEFAKNFDKASPLGFSQWLNEQDIGVLMGKPEHKIFKRNKRTQKNKMTSKYFRQQALP
ncbi:hypothetical protein CU097_003524, partial [Rhizopus azygosporus]